MRVLKDFSKYKIDENGNVYSRRFNRILKPKISKKGYYYHLFVSDFGKLTCVLESRLFAREFLGMTSLYNDLEVDHIDRNPLNNNLKNLQILTKEDHLLKTLKDKGLNSIPNSYCEVCGVKIEKKSKFCRKHTLMKPDINLTLKIIETEVSLCGWVKASKKLGLSDNGLRKRYKFLGGNPKELKRD